MAKETPEKVEKTVEEIVEKTVEEPTKEGGTPAWADRLEAKIEKLLVPLEATAPVKTEPEIIPAPPAPMKPEPAQGAKKYTLKDILDQIW